MSYCAAVLNAALKHLSAFIVVFTEYKEKSQHDLKKIKIIKSSLNELPFFIIKFYKFCLFLQ